MRFPESRVDLVPAGGAPFWPELILCFSRLNFFTLTAAWKQTGLYWVAGVGARETESSLAI